jgi:hypothetical protein
MLWEPYPHHWVCQICLFSKSLFILAIGNRSLKKSIFLLQHSIDPSQLKQRTTTLYDVVSINNASTPIVVNATTSNVCIVQSFFFWGGLELEPEMFRTSVLWLHPRLDCEPNLPGHYRAQWLSNMDSHKASYVTWQYLLEFHTSIYT